MSRWRRAWTAAAWSVVVLGAVEMGQAQSPEVLSPTLRDTLKGEIRLAEVPALPQLRVPLSPPLTEITGVAAGEPRCGAALASVPLPIGPRDQFAAAKSAGLGFLGTLAAVASGGKFAPGGSRGAEKKDPPVLKDPIRSKYRQEVKDKPSGIKLDLGAQLDGHELLLSTRLDSVSGKGTVHEIYLERDDCRRIYPTAEYLYELWGSWSLSVSWTRTESTYQDNKLVNQQTTSGGFMRSGTFGPGGVAALDAAFASLPPDLAGPARRYQTELRDEMTLPMWRRLGFAAPTSGARTVGSRFILSAGDLAALGAGRLAAIVQVTREHGAVFEAVGVPVSLRPGKDTYLAFAALNRSGP
jgi:hypothetical protein